MKTSYTPIDLHIVKAIGILAVLPFKQTPHMIQNIIFKLLVAAGVVKLAPSKVRAR